MASVKFSLAVIIASLIIVACSSQQQQETELEATEQPEGQDAESDDGNDSGSSDEMDSIDEDLAEIEGEVDPSAADEPVVEPLEEIASGGGNEDVGSGLSGLGGGTDSMAAPAPVPAPPAGDAAPSAERVVRYVKESNVPIHSAPDPSAGQVGSLRKGDRVVVIMQGDWAQINSTHFVEKKFLSSKGVGRERTQSQWQKPGN